MIPFGGHIKKQMPGLRPLSFFIAVTLGLFHEPFLGGRIKKQMPGLRPLSFFIAVALGLFHEPFWGAHQKTNAGASPLIIFHCCRFGIIS
jgi:hypothetical protein